MFFRSMIFQLLISITLSSKEIILIIIFSITFDLNSAYIDIIVKIYW